MFLLILIDQHDAIESGVKVNVNYTDLSKSFYNYTLLISKLHKIGTRNLFLLIIWNYYSDNRISKLFTGFVETNPFFIYTKIKDVLCADIVKNVPSNIQ
ncbi:Uncharacterized protein FWK35_00005167 [Aphis craccivora]|uniref:Uncharacterized protein n=1 Tax=Aphis craccivora TaxID=307492 RepID=A0A6G0ZPR7_APHCR|nr:Uncharacterized protein FWK35_00005167 [Aphis craccivora]